jgi:GMP synthase (glutamine-hydrolysing)
MRAGRMMLKNFKESIVIIDFGSQYTHLITKKVRGLGVYSEIVSPETNINEIISLKPKGIILSGGPGSVYEEDALFPCEEIFKLGIPVLGICYGLQLIAKVFNGIVARGTLGEFGRNEVKVVQKSRLFDSIPKKSIVWMSHGDYVDKAPAGFNVTSLSENGLIASIEKDNIFGIQFHPEVDHTEFGKEIISNFLFKICGVSPSWSISGFAAAKINEIRETAKDSKVISGLSGGVDSSVATILVAGT